MKLSDIRLSTRITAAALAIVGAGAFGLMHIEESRLREIHFDEQRGQLAQSLHAEKQRLNMALDKLRRDALFLSDTPPVSGIIRATKNGGIDPRENNTREVWERRLQEIFSAFASANPYYYRICYIGVADGGRELVHVDMRDGGAEAISQAELERKSGLDYFKATAATGIGQVHLSEFGLNQEPVAAMQSMRPTLSAAVPVFAPDGELFGMIAIDMDVGQLLSSVSQGLSTGIRAYIANMNGDYLLHPDAGKAFAFESGRKESITADFPPLARLAGMGVPDYLPLQRYDAGKDGYYLAAERAHFDPARPERFLILAYEIPVSVMESGIASIPLHTILGGLLALLLVGGIVLLVLRRTFAPLRQLTEAAGRIADGDYAFDMPRRKGGEIGQLARAIETMLDRLLQRGQEVLQLNADLEEKVKQRTDELRAANARLEEEIAVRTRAENFVRRENEFRKELIEALPGIFYMINANGRFLMWNRNLREVLRIGDDELARTHPLDLFEGGDRLLIAAKIKETLDQGEAAVEAVLVTKDGRKIPYHFTGRRVEHDGGPVLIGMGLDITKRRQAEEALRVAAVAFETRDAILITDADANIIRINRAFTEITGYLPQDVLGKNPRIMSSGKHDHAFFIEMWQKLQHTGSWSGEVWDKRKNGEVYPKWMTITAVKNQWQETTQYVAIFSDITERKRAEEEIRILAFYDTLTKLPNRRLFLERLRAALPASARRHDYGAVMFLDMDKFKIINDTLGHDYGDLMLIEVARRIKDCVREMDTVARLGGDEFVVLVEGISNDEHDASYKIGTVAEKIREALAQPYLLKEHEYHSSPSIGITLYHGNEETVDILLRHADLAMYQVKNEGRNAIRFFDPVMQDNAERHDALREDLCHAIERGELRLYYQVQVDSGQHPVGAEALLRWQHPLRGLVMPDQFIPVAEESPLILGIGHWVLDEACAQLARWHDNERMRDLALTVNVSARQFVQPDFVEQVAALVERHRIEPARLKLELTNSVASGDLNGTVEKMRALRSLGVSLSINDFDTVYSSLYYLKQLSSDQIKIHRQIVQGVTAEGSDAQLVQAIVDLAKSMEIDVFAEGVETDAQLAFFKQHACKTYQGYLFSMPVPIEAFEALLEERASDRNG